MPALTHEDFAARLTELMLKAQTNPAAYRRRMWGWVLLGYLFIVLLLLGSVGLVASLLWLMADDGVGGFLLKLLPLAYLVWQLSRLTRVKFAMPTGRPLSSAEAGPLHELLRAQTRTLRAPAVHQVLLTSEYSAAAVQVPRLGVLGWQRNYVILGLPLLQTLSPAQAAAVVAHELAHLHGGHSHFAALVQRVNRSWAQLREQFGRSESNTLVQRFADWYVPHFNTWSHPLRRTTEFEADLAAARLTSPAALAEALCVLEVQGPALARLYWQPLELSMSHEPAPPADAISGLLPVARTARLPAAEASALLRQATEADPDPFGTHPTLGERLAALGQAPAAPAPPATTAAEAWLGGSLPALAQALDADWATDRAQMWRERYAVLRVELGYLAILNKQLADGQILSEADAWMHADFTNDHVGEAEALPLFRALFHSRKHGAAARFAVGCILIGQDDAAGLALLEEAMAGGNPDFVEPGLALLRAYHQRRGDYEAARQLSARQYQHADLAALMQAERQGITPADTLLAHNLADDELVTLRAVLSEPTHRVAQAWLLRKQLTYLAAEKPFFLLLLRAARGPNLETDPQIMAWYEQLLPSIVLPGHGVVVPVVREFRWVGSTALQLTGSEIYRAAPS